jgi:hypothetical protein
MVLNILIGGAASVVVSALLAVGGALLVQRFAALDRRQANNDVSGLAFAIIGVLYAILLTFVTISVWETNDHARDSSRREALAVVDLRRHAETLDAPNATTLRDLTDRYAGIVVHDEWPRMAHGRPVGPQGGAVLDAMWQAVDAPDPGDENAIARAAEARGVLRDLASARDARLSAIGAGLPGVMWLALLVGAALMVVNSMMFGVQGGGQYVTIVAMLASISALMLFAVYQLEYPYQRGESVRSDVFTAVVGGPVSR